MNASASLARLDSGEKRSPQSSEFIVRETLYFQAFFPARSQQGTSTAYEIHIAPHRRAIFAGVLAMAAESKDVRYEEWV